MSQGGADPPKARSRLPTSAPGGAVGGVGPHSPVVQLTVRSRLDELAPAWDALVDAQALPSPFLASWWLEHAAGGEPVLLTVSDGEGQLLGGAAFERDLVGRGPLRVERLRSLGQGPLAPDHLDVVAAPGHDADVLGAVRAWIRRRGNRVVDLDGLAADGRLARVLGRWEIDRVAAPYTVVPAEPGGALAARPGQLRSTVRRTAKRLGATGATVRRVDPSGATDGFRALAELHEGRWADESDFLDAWDRFAAAAGAGLADGRVELHQVLAADGTVVATELDLRAGSRLAFYQAGRRTEREWRGVGSWLRGEILDDAARRGITEYDLLRGDEPYKADWADGRRDLVRVRFGVGPVGNAFAATVAGWRALAPRLNRVPSQPDR
jgi:CelD/BcsL family acetyltransferase involved in cellulose biosynthesis